MLQTSVEYQMTNEKISSAIYQYLIHLEAQNIIKDFIDPAVNNMTAGKHLQVELKLNKWHFINVYFSNNQSKPLITSSSAGSLLSDDPYAPLPPMQINLLP